MTKAVECLTPCFVEFIPKELDDGVLYFSIEYATTAHRCACGCGEKVVLPLHPTDWRLTYDGKSITMRPSVGNWGFACRSHYLITNNRIVWASQWTEEQIEEGRRRDAARKGSWYTKPVSPPSALQPKGTTTAEPGRFTRWLKQLFGS